MPSRRLFLATFLAASTLLVEAAAGQGNGNGNGGGNGNGNGNGGGNGNGNGNGGGNGNGNGNGDGNGAVGGGDGSESATGVEAESAPTPSLEKPSNVRRSLRLRHSNGFEEELGAGRYEMRDNRGRRIINRAARWSDFARLRRLMRK